jgi:4-diphosphocytidyl-2-C-methyl-D-erythritol kinase
VNHATAAGIRIAAPAKINLYLHVVGRRPDGYHLLDSLIAFTEVGDELTLVPARELTLVIDGPFADRLETEGDNLVLRAARALSDLAGATRGAAVRLTKRLPVAAGIGGGSADAAAALIGLARLWRLDLPAARLAEIGLSLGADLPACLAGTTCFVGGIGERIERAPALPNAHLVLVNPGTPLPTAAVFKERAAAPGDEQSVAAERFAAPMADALALAGLIAKRRNDLAAAATRLVPAIADVLTELERRPGCLIARLSGSGATCFGLFADRGTAREAAAAIAAEQPGWWVTPTLLRHGPPEPAETVPG